MKLCMLLLTLLTPITPIYSYDVPGATVATTSACGATYVTITYHFTSTSVAMSPRRYRIPGIDRYETVSLLSGADDTLIRDGDIVTWHPHAAGLHMWVVAGGLPECPTTEGVVEAVGRTWLPLMLR